MIQPAFDIGNADEALQHTEGQLLVEISAQSLNFILFTRDPRELLLLRQYRLYTTGDRSPSDLIHEVIESDQFIREHAGRALIVYNFPESSLIPDEFYDDTISGPMNRLIYGDDSSDFIFGEQVGSLRMHNVYRIPRDIHALLKEKFAGSRYWHIYSLLLLAPLHTTGNKANIIGTVFYHDKFIAALHTEGNLQLIQTFNYQTPEDVAYYLLLICRQCGMDLATIDLYVSGLIDSQSALYAELLKYFPEVYLENPPPTINAGSLLDQFPGHYFSPLLKMSLCEL